MSYLSGNPWSEPVCPCSKATTETPEQCVKRRNVALVSLLLTLNKFHMISWSFHCWLWASKCQLRQDTIQKMTLHVSDLLSKCEQWELFQTFYLCQQPPSNFQALITYSVVCAECFSKTELEFWKSIFKKRFLCLFFTFSKVFEINVSILTLFQI